METWFTIANPSVEDASFIFVVEFMADACSGRVRILIDMTAFAWTPVRP